VDELDAVRGAVARLRDGMVWRAAGATSRLTGAAARAHRRLASGAVALTFDDGPNPGSTDRVLDVLADLDVTATFFCVGKNALRHPQLLRRMRDEGHAVGSHSLTHPHPATISIALLTHEYASGRAAVSDALGHDTPLLRPPHGHIGWKGIAVLRRLRVQPWLWSVDPEDWRPGVTRQHVVSIAGEAQAGDVVLLHDWVEQPWAPEALDRSQTVDALPEIVTRIRARGLRFGPVDPA